MVANEPPLVLVRSVASRQVIVAVNPSARGQSIRPGMTLSEARAICANVLHDEHDPHRDAVALEALGRWMMRFSPVVSPLPLQGERGYGLFLDVTGCQRIFHGLENLVRLVEAAFKKLRISACLAIAPTPGAAWAVAAFSKQQNRIISANELSETLEKLPPIALRIEPEIAEALHHLGLQTIGQVLRLPRESLPARFGDQLPLRIDQALGNVPEPLVSIEPFSPITTRMDFEAPIDSLETIWAVLKELIGRLIRDLIKRGRGAQEVQAEFLRAYESPIVKTINLSRASRDAVNLFNLLRCAMERPGEIQLQRRKGVTIKLHSSIVLSRRYGSLDCDRTVPDGFIGIRLTVSRSQRIDDEQIALLECEEFAGQIELDHLIERLSARSGKDIIVQSRPVESHLPEKAFMYYEFSVRVESRAPIEDRCYAKAVRPLQLLRMPEEIRVMVAPSEDREGGRPVSMSLGDSFHHFDQVAGPERIAGIWWDGHDKTRDYFEVEDQVGKRFWIFRVLNSSRWFLHGRFD